MTAGIIVVSFVNLRSTWVYQERVGFFLISTDINSKVVKLPLKNKHFISIFNFCVYYYSIYIC